MADYPMRMGGSSSSSIGAILGLDRTQCSAGPPLPWPWSTWKGNGIGGHVHGCKEQQHPGTGVASGSAGDGGSSVREGRRRRPSICRVESVFKEMGNPVGGGLSRRPRCCFCLAFQRSLWAVFPLATEASFTSLGWRWAGQEKPKALCQGRSARGPRC
ncbi:uncharacterized protein LY79DRAFT_401456 [Colletotrichum navitas]|uniref:Uncharacterized protein n=1 Tax=Colletotrichum navitas TaxID=681940 RepID=A0AAD8UYB9_9PEZI|nr:uncharacterized protein LY79DRAFT_401456 [Colletotrichum navitas]KAK1573596.1 hypothetical protein LY79DRAFT_401456 [Colletotrichum navitas]